MLNREIGKHTLINKQSIAFLGPIGTYSYFAAKKMFSNKESEAVEIGEIVGSAETNKVDEKMEFIAVPSIFDIFEKVKKSEVNLGIVPVENSIEGIVKDSMNLFSNSSIVVLKQCVLDIDHCLLSTSSNIDDVKIVKAHPQALGQCKIWLSKNLPGATLIAAPSNVTTGTASNEAIIASRQVAELYNLHVLSADISDTKDNKTLFYLITQNSNQFFKKETLAKDVESNIQKQGGATVVFLLETIDKVGILRDVLTVFADHSVNVTRLHSLPTGELGRYYFIMDAYIKDDASVLGPIFSKLEGICSSVKVLGTI